MLIYVNDISDASFKYHASGVLCLFFRHIVEADQQCKCFKFGGGLRYEFPPFPTFDTFQMKTMIHSVFFLILTFLQSGKVFK